MGALAELGYKETVIWSTIVLAILIAIILIVISYFYIKADNKKVGYSTLGVGIVLGIAGSYAAYYRWEHPNYLAEGAHKIQGLAQKILKLGRGEDEYDGCTVEDVNGACECTQGGEEFDEELNKEFKEETPMKKSSKKGKKKRKMGKKGADESEGEEEEAEAEAEDAGMTTEEDFRASAKSLAELLHIEAEGEETKDLIEKMIAQPDVQLSEDEKVKAKEWIADLRNLSDEIDSLLNTLSDKLML